MEMKTYVHEFGAISEFLSPEKRCVFRRINIEYLWLLQRRKPGEMQAIIWEGVRSNLPLETDPPHTETDSRSPSQLTDIARRIVQHSQILATLATSKIATPLQPLNGILQPLDAKEKSLAHSGTAVSNELTRQANNDIREAMAGDREHGKWLLIAAFKQLHKAIRLNPRNYKAHFDYAWLCSFFFRNPAKAGFHLEKTVQEAFEHHLAFTIFALRHLAEARRDLQKYDGAVEAANEAYMLDREHTPQIQFDLARYLTLAQQHEKAAKYLEGLLAEHPEYYWQVLAEPDFRDNPDVAGLMEALSREFLPADDPGVGDISYADEINETALAKTLVENRSINLQMTPPVDLPEMDPAIEADFETDEDFDEALEAMRGDLHFDEAEDESGEDEPFNEAKDLPDENESFHPEEPEEEILMSSEAGIPTGEPENMEIPGIHPETEHLPGGDGTEATGDRPDPGEQKREPHFLDLFVIEDKDAEAPAPGTSPSPAALPETAGPFVADESVGRNAEIPTDLSDPDSPGTETPPDTEDAPPTQTEAANGAIQFPVPPADENEPAEPQREYVDEPAAHALPGELTKETPPEIFPDEERREEESSPPSPTAEGEPVESDPRADTDSEDRPDPSVPSAYRNVVIVKPPHREGIIGETASPAPVLPETHTENPTGQLQNVLNRIRRTYIEPAAESPDPEEGFGPAEPDINDLMEMFDNFSLAAVTGLPEPPEAESADATPDAPAEMPGDNLGLPHARELLEEVGGLTGAGETDDLSGTFSTAAEAPADPDSHAETGMSARQKVSNQIDAEVLQLLQRIGQRFDGSAGTRNEPVQPPTQESAFPNEKPAEPAPEPADHSEALAASDDDPIPPYNDGEALFLPEEQALIAGPEQQDPSPGDGAGDDEQDLLGLIDRAGTEPAFQTGQHPETDTAGDETEAQGELSALLHQIEDNHLEFEDVTFEEEESDPEYQPILKLQEIPPATPLPQNELGISPAAGTPNEYERIIAEIRQEMELAKQRCAKLKSIFTRRDLKRTQQRIEQIALDAIEKLPSISEMDYPKYLRSTRRSLGRQVEFFRARHRIISRLKRA